MSEEQLQHLLDMLKVLADESRLRMVGILATRACTGVELAELLQLRAATVSHHLARLREAGLVEVRSEGTTKWYSLNSQAIDDLQEDLLKPARVADLVPEAAPDAYTQKVLDTFVTDGKLGRIPASRRKREVVLRWLLDGFERDRTYTEREVNDLIGRVHWDTATLRRELIMAGWMTRHDGIYRRVE